MSETNSEASITYNADRVRGQISITDEPDPDKWVGYTLSQLYEMYGPIRYSYTIRNLTFTNLLYDPLCEGEEALSQFVQM